MSRLAFLLDCDNTLIDNDALKEDLSVQIERLVGTARAEHFWQLYEHVRIELDYVDFNETLTHFGRAYPDERNYPELCAMSLGYPFDKVRYPAALEVIAHLRTMGTVAILSDGDPVFQAAKIARAGLAGAVDGPVLIFDHKELHLHEVQARLPAEHYVTVDDKPRLLAAMKEVLRDRVTTVLVRQGKYAREQGASGPTDGVDVDLGGIGEVLGLGVERLGGRER